MIEGAGVIAEALQDGGELAVDLATDVVVAGMASSASR